MGALLRTSRVLPNILRPLGGIPTLMNYLEIGKCSHSIVH